MTTAIRTWKGAKALITITYDDGRTETAGGARAARAQAVIVGRHPQCQRPDELGIIGVRGDLARAQVEAHRLTTQTEMRTGRNRVTIPLIPFTEAIAVTVTGAACPGF